MAIDPSISLGVRPPVIAPPQIQSPLEQFAKVQSLRNLMQQGQLGQLNIQQTQLQNQALQEKQRRSQAVADLFTGGTRPTEDHILAVGGPDAAAAIKGLHDADKAKFDALEATNKAITRTALGIKSLPPEQRDFGFRAERSRLVTLNPALAQQIPEQYPGDSWLDSKINEGMNADQYLSNVRADAEAKLKAPGLAADAATKQAESEQKQRQIEASTLAPALARGGVAYQQALAAMPPARAALYQGFQTPRDLLMFASTPTEQITAQQAADTAKATAAQRVVQNANEAARLGIERTKSTREQNIYDQTYGSGANPALVGVDPKLRTQVTKEAQKIGDEYLKGQEAADQMQSLIELTRTGNKAAGSNLPLIGVETLNAINGIKRINRSEIDQYKGAGSLYDSIMGKIGGLTVGQPIPADVLKDIEAMHNTLREGAESSYKTRLQGINDNYKSNFQPVRTPAANAAQPVKPAAGQYKQGDTRVIDGKTYTRDANGNWK